MTRDLPILYHGEVLGVDIADAPPESNDYPRTDLHAWPGRYSVHPRVYVELCDWIRRNRLHV